MNIFRSTCKIVLFHTDTCKNWRHDTERYFIFEFERNRSFLFTWETLCEFNDSARFVILSIVEKKNGSDFRLIHHLSYPQNKSVNDFIDPQLCHVQYTNFDEAIAMVQEPGQGCLLGKSDIKPAFRLIPVNPNDFDQLGFPF